MAELHFADSILSPLRGIDVSPRAVEVPAEMSFPLEMVVASLWLLMGPSRKRASHLAQLRLSNGRIMKSFPPPPTAFELLMARCKRLSDHKATKPSAGGPSNAHREGGWCPSCQKKHVFCNDFEPLTLLLQKTEMSGCSPQV